MVRKIKAAVGVGGGVGNPIPLYSLFLPIFSCFMDIDLFESREVLKYSSSPRMISILFFHGSLILFSHLSSLSCSRSSSHIHVVHCGLFVVFTFINMSQGWSRQLISDFTVVVGICFFPRLPYVVLGQWIDHFPPANLQADGWKYSREWAGARSC